MLETGCSLTGLEPGGNLGDLAKKRLGGYENLDLRGLTLQDYDCPDNAFDLVYAATAFHWIPEEYGYRRVYDLSLIHNLRRRRIKEGWDWVGARGL